MPSIASVWVEVVPETSKIADGIKDAFRRVDPDAREAGQRWRREIEQGLGGAKVKLEADTAKARAELDEASHDRRSTVHVDVDKSQLGSVEQDVASAISQGGQSGITALNPALLGIGGTMLAGIASALSGLAGLAPAGLLGAGGVVGTLAIGLDGVKDAYDAVGKASQSSNKDQAAQAREVTSAQRGLTDAVQSQSAAQKDVANAYRDSRNQLDDLNLSLKGGQISEAQAYNDVLKARRDLARGGFKDQLDLNDAQLRVSESEQRWQESRQRNIELQQKGADANAKGVQGSDLVVAAKEKERRATETVTAAQDTLSVATSKTSEAAQSAIQAMAQLSPNAQSFVTVLEGLKPAFKDLKDSVQDALFANLGAQFQQLSTTYLPLLKGFFTSFASTINQSFGQIAGILESPQMLKTVQSLFTNLGDAFRNFAPAIGPLVDGFLQLSQVGSTFLPALGSAFTDAAQGFSQFVTQATQSGQLQTWIQTGITALGQLSSIMQMLSIAFFNLAPIGSATLGMLQQVLPTLLPAVGPLAKAFSDWLNALSPLLEIIGKLAGGLLVTFAGMVSDLSATISRGLADYGKYVDFFVKLYSGIGDLVGEGPAVSGFFDSFKSSAEKLLNPLQLIMDAVDAIKDAYSLITTGHLPTVFTPFSAAAQASPSIFGGVTPPGAPAPTGAPSSFIGSGGQATQLTPNGVAPIPQFNVPSGGAPVVAPTGQAFTVTPQGVANATALAQSVSGQKYGYGGTGDAAHGGLYDCSGLIGALYGAMTGQQTTARFFTTETDLTKFGFQATNTPVPGTFQVGIHHGGGGPNSHTAGTLPNGVNVESGGNGTLYGGKAAGAWDKEFETHYFLPGSNVAGGQVVPGAGSLGSLAGNGSLGVPQPGVPAAAAVPGAPAGVAPFTPAAGPVGTLNDPLNVSLPSSQVSQMSSAAQQLGQGLVGGILQEFGVDGSVLKDPTQFGAFKFLKAGMGILTKPSGGAEGGGGTGGGGSILGSMLSGLTGAKAGQFMPAPPDQPVGALGPPTGPAPGPGGPMIGGDYMPINVSPNVDPKAILGPVQQQQNAVNSSSFSNSGGLPAR